MASVFTFESEPPQVSSPWPIAPKSMANNNPESGECLLAGMRIPPAELAINSGRSKLDAEPQEGPTEYKLHLLLRPRRNFTITSTVQNVSGSFASKSHVQQSHSDTSLVPATLSPILAPSSQTRKNRLQHLTTQLLWRLQQSSTYHSSSKSSLVSPVLPEADIQLAANKGPGPLMPGLEESRGALYEIGVSDDGTFVGLARDELEESLIVLRAMAFSLGCDVGILRMIIVGDCEWTEEHSSRQKTVSRQRKEKLWVVEALVAPHIGFDRQGSQPILPAPSDSAILESVKDMTFDKRRGEEVSQSEQLRISLTGSTTSGKSSLLGTLSTSTLDNGRGKSRLSLLKHRHEIVSGVTSSLAQELFGYQEVLSNGISKTKTNVINYASGNVSSWNDIHSVVGDSRLVFVTDSAGHPRYRRTTLRGLISWAPHWTLCCIAADDEDDSSGKVGATATSSEILGAAGDGVDLSKAHLDLCLKLKLKLIIVITKLDIATKTGLRNTLTKVLTTLKTAGRRPIIMSTSTDGRGEDHLQSVKADDIEAVRRAIDSVSSKDLDLLVPVVLTSAVTGIGIGRLHALLRQLPISFDDQLEVTSLAPQDHTALPRILFHVDEVFVMPKSRRQDNATYGTILSGYLRFGKLDLGDKMLIGPCTMDTSNETHSIPEMHRASSFPGLIKGSPKAVTLAHDGLGFASGNHGPHSALAPDNAQHWQEVRVSSLRNLRLPVRELLAGQVGTVGISLLQTGFFDSNDTLSSSLEIRRGTVMISAPRSSLDELPPIYSRFSAVFSQAGLPAWPGVIVIVYIASIRAIVRIVEVKALERKAISEEFIGLDDATTICSDSTTHDSFNENDQTELTFEFATSVEWIEIGTQVLVTPGGGPSLTGQPEQREIGSAGLDGYVGIIVHATNQHSF